MTAFGSQELLDEARRLGVFTVLDKPFELDELDLAARARPRDAATQLTSGFSVPVRTRMLADRASGTRIEACMRDRAGLSTTPLWPSPGHHGALVREACRWSLY
ncbi:MAG: hypothetical protein QM736_20040 [Vicinamibacterales bacterium]